MILELDPYQKGAQHIKQGATGLIVMSLDNGYFTKANIEHLLTAAEATYERTKVLIPDQLSIYNYLAEGQPIARAQQKAKHKANNYRNRCEASGARFDYIDWQQDIASVERYRELLTNCIKNYEEKEYFRTDVNAAVKKVSDSRCLAVAKNYLLEELAALEFLSETEKNLVWTYHKEWPILEKFLQGRYDGQRKDIGANIICQ